MLSNIKNSANYEKYVFKKVYTKEASSYKGVGLFAGEDIKQGERILHFEGRLGKDEDTNPESMQIDEDLFLESTIKIDDAINHSCDPNCFVDWRTLDLVALKDIKKDEEITINYCTFEYDLINMRQNCSFKCFCGSKNCYKEVKGFKYLDLNQKLQIKELLSPFLKRKLEEEIKEKESNRTK